MQIHSCEFDGTLPKFNSSPLKSYRNPIGKDRLLFQPPLFTGELLNFGGVCIILQEFLEDSYINKPQL